MLAALRQTSALPDKRALSRASHVLVVGQSPEELAALPAIAAGFAAASKRRRLKREELHKSAVSFNLASGALVSVVLIDVTASAFARLAGLRAAAGVLLDEMPGEVMVCVLGENAANLAREALFVLWANGAPLPVTKKKDERHVLKAIALYGARDRGGFAETAALAAGNTLARVLSTTAPNELAPAQYRKRIRALAKTHGWKCEEFDFRKLQAMGAGAFVAVAQGSGDETAAIVHLTYAPRNAKKTLALVGKGICFDTGGHNLKPAKYMAGMHEDMNGSAVVLGILQALSEMRVPVRVDAWLAIAQNHISPAAYKQNDIVTALDGTTIEVVHTDAEGRMVLADTLTLASRAKPDLVIDFATLTGAMAVALGSRYSGVFASDATLAGLAVEAGVASGERVMVFPMDEDYEKPLESRVADIKQCTLEGEADHILAARFLKRFVGKRAWMHVDLSAAICTGGLGAIASDTTGFGVVWGAALAQAWVADSRS